MMPDKMEDTAETRDAERVSGGRRAGLWKVLAGSLALVVLGFAVAAGFGANSG